MVLPLSWHAFGSKIRFRLIIPNTHATLVVCIDSSVDSASLAVFPGALLRYFILLFLNHAYSHVNAEVPGCIHEGGELGYALSVSFGAVMDQPDLVVACVVGDGESETGPTAT